MAANKELSIKIEGSKELRRLIRKAEAKDLDDALKEAHRKASLLVVSDVRQFTVPIKGGSLFKSVRAAATKGAARIRAGSAAIKYAGVIHYGWPARKIKSQPFVHESLKRRWDQVYSNYEEEYEAVKRALSTKRF